MTGNKTPSIGLTGITFEDFYVRPGFLEKNEINNKNTGWALYVDFTMGERTAEWDHITIIITLNFSSIPDNIKISSLKIKSSFKVTHGLPYPVKFKMLELLINNTVGQLQGGWSVFHTNRYLKDNLPQAFFQQNMIEGELKKKLYEHWD